MRANGEEEEAGDRMGNDDVAGLARDPDTAARGIEILTPIRSPSSNARLPLTAPGPQRWDARASSLAWLANADSAAARVSHQTRPDLRLRVEEWKQ